MRVFAACLLAAVLPAQAEVKSITAQGFAVAHQIELAVSPAPSFSALITPGSWWSPAHTYSGDARNMSLDASVGGCFCERWGKGNAVEHMRVLYLQPEKVLRLSGGLGPLQAHGLSGTLTVSLKVVDGGTQLNAKYSVGGYMAGGFNDIAPAVDQVLTEQWQRLKRYLETGSPATPAK
jgi:hypothetical protein